MGIIGQLCNYKKPKWLFVLNRMANGHTMGVVGVVCNSLKDKSL